MIKEKERFYKMMSNCLASRKVTDDYSENKDFLEKIAVANKSITFYCESSKFVNIDPGEEIKNITLQIVAHNYKNLMVQNKIIAYLAKNGIPCVVLKGAGVAADYPDPTLRPFGDIDLLVSREDYDKSITLLLGEEERDKIRAMHKFHYQLTVDNIIVEIHNAVTHFTDDESKAKEYMNDAMGSCKTKSIDSFKFPVLTEAFQAPALLLHTKAHYFENKLTFRMLSDWAMFVDKISDEMWNENIYPVLENIELNKFTDAINSVCNKYLDLKFENKIHTDVDEKIIEQLANEFISDALGDDTDKQKTNTLKNAVSFINNIARRDFSLTGKKKYLSPLFWPVILVRYIYRRKIGLREKIDVLEYFDDYSVKEKMYKEIQEQ